jgi:hypothetical protein
MARLTRARRPGAPAAPLHLPFIQVTLDAPPRLPFDLRVAMTTSQIVPALLVPLLAWRMYLRFRRTVGPQPYQANRLLGTAIFFSVVTAILALATAAASRSALGALGGGLLVAFGLGALALRLTTWQNSAAGEFYVPNRTIGIAVTLLFIGRIVYRIVTMAGMPVDAGSRPAVFQSPITLFILGITTGYYITYYLGLYLRGRQELDAARGKEI